MISSQVKLVMMYWTDQICQSDKSTETIDTLILKPGITLDDVVFLHSSGEPWENSDLIVQLKNSTDSIRIKWYFGGYEDYQNCIEKIVFSDGTELGYDEVCALLSQPNPSQNPNSDVTDTYLQALSLQTVQLIQAMASLEGDASSSYTTTDIFDPNKQNYSNDGTLSTGGNHPPVFNS